MRPCVCVCSRVCSSGTPRFLSLRATSARSGVLRFHLSTFRSSSLTCVSVCVCVCVFFLLFCALRNRRFCSWRTLVSETKLGGVRRERTPSLPENAVHTVRRGIYGTLLAYEQLRRSASDLESYCASIDYIKALYEVLVWAAFIYGLPVEWSKEKFTQNRVREKNW